MPVGQEPFRHLAEPPSVDPGHSVHYEGDNYSCIVNTHPTMDRVYRHPGIRLAVIAGETIWESRAQ